MAVKPTPMKIKITNTLPTTSTFSTRAVVFVPRHNKTATIKTANNEAISIIPPFPAANDPAKAGGKTRLCDPRNSLKFADQPDATKATAIKYSAKSAQPAIQPNTSPKTTFAQV